MGVWSLDRHSGGRALDRNEERDEEQVGARVASELEEDVDGEGVQNKGENDHAGTLPPEPADRADYWKGLTHVDGTHHVFPGDRSSHLEEVQRLGWDPTVVKDYWGWNPYAERWESFNNIARNYAEVWDELGMGHGGGAGAHAAPTVAPEWNFSKVAYGEDFEWPYAEPTAKLHFPEGWEESWGHDLHRPQRVPFVYTVHQHDPNDVRVYLGHPGSEHWQIMQPAYDDWSYSEQRNVPIPAMHDGLDAELRSGNQIVGGFGSVKPRSWYTGDREDNDRNIEYYEVGEPHAVKAVADALTEHKPFGLPAHNFEPWEKSKAPEEDDWYFEGSVRGEKAERQADRQPDHHDPLEVLAYAEEASIWGSLRVAAHPAEQQQADGHPVDQHSDNLSHQLHYRPGQPGKGLIDANGIAHTWNVEGGQDGWPSHADYVSENNVPLPLKGGIYLNSLGKRVWDNFRDDDLWERLGYPGGGDDWRFGSSLPPLMYHWTEARNAPWIADEGLRGPGVYLTLDDDPNQLNADIPSMDIPFRVTVDTSALSPDLIGQSATEGYPGTIEHNLRAHGNLYYNGSIPPSAIVEMRKFKRVQEPEFAL